MKKSRKWVIIDAILKCLSWILSVTALIIAINSK